MATRKNGNHSRLWEGPRRGAKEARQENPTTAYHESEDVAARAQEEGRRETLDLLHRIRLAHGDKRALAAIRAGLP